MPAARYREAGVGAPDVYLYCFSHFHPPMLMDTEKYESPYVTMWIKEGILFARFTSNLEMTLDVARTCVEARIFFSRGVSYPICVDMRDLKSMDKQARQYLASMGATLVTAGALITPSAISRTMGNIFLKVDRPPVPTRLFTSEEKAVEWLRKFVPSDVPAGIGFKSTVDPT